MIKLFSRLLVFNFAALVTGSQSWTLEPFSNMGAGDKADVKIGECPMPLCLLKLCGLQAVWLCIAEDSSEYGPARNHRLFKAL